DLARPVEGVPAAGRVVGAGRSRGVAGLRAVGLGRALVEVLVVPRRRERAQVTAEVTGGVGADAGRADLGSRLRIGRVGGRGEVNAVELLRVGDAVGPPTPRAVERRIGIGLER